MEKINHIPCSSSHGKNMVVNAAVQRRIYVNYSILGD